MFQREKECGKDGEKGEQRRAAQRSERAIEFVVYISSTSALGGEN